MICHGLASHAGMLSYVSETGEVLKAKCLKCQCLSTQVLVSRLLESGQFGQAFEEVTLELDLLHFTLVSCR